MPIMSTPQHLKHAKTRATKLKGKAGTTMGFCLLRKKGTKEVIIHFDKPAAVSRFKNPATIQKVLQKTAAFRYPSDHPFFTNISKIISVAGLVTSMEDEMLFQQTVAGRAGQADLAIVCKDLKISKFAFEKGISDKEESEASDTDAALIDRLKDIDFLDAMLLAADPLAVFASFDELAATIDALSNTGRDEKLDYQLKQLQAWSPDSVEAVTEGMEELAGITDFSAELDDLMVYEIDAEQEMIQSIKVLKEGTQEALRVKGFWEGAGYLLETGKWIATLSEGKYMYIPRIKAEYGGGSLVLVADKWPIPHEDTLNELAADESRWIGSFQKSRSGKKIAFTGMPSREDLRNALQAIGLSLAVYKVDSFTDLQDELQKQKGDVEEDDNIAPILERLKHNQIDLPSSGETINGGVLCEAFYRFLITEFAAENLAFILCIEGRTGFLLDKHKRSSMREIYEDYVKSTGSLEINVGFTQRGIATEIGEDDSQGEGRFAAMMPPLVKEIRKVLLQPYSRFVISDTLARAIYRDPVLKSTFVPDL